MIHSNAAIVSDGQLTIDRKFHDGMLSYVDNLGVEITTVHPRGDASLPVMDPVRIPLRELAYGIIVADPQNAEWAGRLSESVRRSGLVYGQGLGSEGLAWSHGVKQIAVLEYDLPTQLVVSASSVSNVARKASRTLKTILAYRRSVHQWRRMAALHCNGYPIYDATERLHRERLLYLDSRMDAGMIIGRNELERRLGRPNSRLRLLYSGRYEPMKGALDAVKVAINCIRRGLDVELACYGQGSQGNAMRKLVADAGCHSRIVVHEAVPFPELVRISREFDLFVCCHVQADPSCTYLESFGAGLPIVGYDNSMWRRLCEESKAGFASRLSRPDDVATHIASLTGDRHMLAGMSRRARSFAAEHTFELEFKKRTDDIRRRMRPEALPT